MWHSENFIFKERIRYENAGGGFVWPEKIIPLELKEASYGNLFTYMYRRFGIPSHGSDGYKEIANWYIITPNEDIALRVSPRPSGIKYSFGYVINRSEYHDNRNETQVHIVTEALLSTMNDLLSPVFVRDVPINAIGCISDDYNWDDNANECDPWKWAGYGVSIEYFKETFGEP